MMSLGMDVLRCGMVVEGTLGMTDKDSMGE